MNLANNISRVDEELKKATERFAEYYVSSDPDHVPHFVNMIQNVWKDEYYEAVYSTSVDPLETLKEIRYFSHKTDRLQHNVLVSCYHGIDYYFIQKDDGSMSVCTAEYLLDEISIHLRIDSYYID